jgi:hypothetical protein
VTPASYQRDLDARNGALASMIRAHERFAEQEQVLMLEGREDDARTMHDWALRLLRAYDVEQNDPEPVEGPWCECKDCLRYRLRSPE